MVLSKAAAAAAAALLLASRVVADMANDPKIEDVNPAGQQVVFPWIMEYAGAHSYPPSTDWTQGVFIGCSEFATPDKPCEWNTNTPVVGGYTYYPNHYTHKECRDYCAGASVCFGYAFQSRHGGHGDGNSGGGWCRLFGDVNGHGTPFATLDWGEAEIARRGPPYTEWQQTYLPLYVDENTGASTAITAFKMAPPDGHPLHTPPPFSASGKAATVVAAPTTTAAPTVGSTSIGSSSTSTPSDTPAPYYTGGKPDYRNDAYGTDGRNGVTSQDQLAPPAPVVGVPFQSAATSSQGADGTPLAGKGPLKGAGFQGEYQEVHHDGYGQSGVVKADESVINTQSASGSACSGRGFKCDFAEKNKLGLYSPLDFVWKVINPDDYTKNAYDMTTLNCEVMVTAASGGETDFFYVPLGQENMGSADYCDMEAVRRTVDNTAQNMTSTIRVRGETTRLNNMENADHDLIGENFDLVCQCTTVLATESSLMAQQSDTALLTKMESTGQFRTMGIEIKLYEDELLKKEVRAPTPFPKSAANFYFLVRHLLENDWDFMLQVTKCVACSADFAAQGKCTTESTDAQVVTFWKDCGIIQGGPRFRGISGASWYKDHSNHDTSSQYNNTDYKPLLKWSSAAPNRCPYHAFGLQKFRLQTPGSNTMAITCKVHGCSQRPCTPCSQVTGDSRRRSLSMRRLQEAVAEEEEATQVGLSITFPAAASGSSDSGADAGSDGSAKKKGTVSIILLLIVLLLLIAAAVTLRYTLKERSKVADGRKVQIDQSEAEMKQASRAENTNRRRVV